MKLYLCNKQNVNMKGTWRIKENWWDVVYGKKKDKKREID